MKLLSATLRNYRVHRELSVDFDPRLTLITGPNETGKSTLVEALHRGLFLRYKTGGELQRAMVSDHGGHPEVEIHFEAGGRTATLKKVFRGPSGTCVLAVTGQPALNGDAAEEALAALLKTGAQATGRGSGIEKRWAHLWVWQGTSGIDPAATVAEQQEDLIRRLQATGGNALVLSALDARIASAIRKRKDELLTTSGEARANTDWHRALQDVARLQTEQARRLDIVNTLDEAAARYHQALETITRKNHDLALAREERDTAQRKRDQAEQLERDLAPLQREHDSLEQALAALEKTAAQLALAETERTAAATKLDAGRTALTPLKEAAESAAAQAREAATAASEARRAHDRARQRVEALAHHLNAHEKAVRLDELQAASAHIETRQQDLARLRQQLDELPAVTAQNLENLQALKDQTDAATARLDALGARIKLLSTNTTIAIDGHPLAPSAETIITAPATIRIGSSTELLVSPGSHADLDSARENSEACRRQFAEALAASGVADLATARKARLNRESLDQHIIQIEGDLKRLNPAAIQRQTGDVRREQREAVRCATQLATDTSINLPPTLLETKTAHKLAVAERQRLATLLDAAETRKDASEQNQLAAASAWQEKEHEVRELESRLAKADLQIELIEKQQGNREDRTIRLLDLQARRTTAADSIQHLRAQINALQPTLQDNNIKRLDRSIQQLDTALQAAERERIINEDRLRQNGSSDPHAELALATVDLANATARCRALEQQARALQLLAELAATLQREAAAEFTRPLASAAASYLQCLFGADASASLAWDETSRLFTGLLVHRPSAGYSDFAFDHLSGGTREQVGVALRLAMAEILAGDHDGSLPIVLDDAFANSDPARVKTLQAMLDLAANRCLQVIVLTCNPSDYSTLGAHEIQLTRT